MSYFSYIQITKKSPDRIECAIAVKYYDGDILTSLMYEDLAYEEYKYYSNGKISRISLAMTKLKKTQEFQSKNVLLKFSDFLSCNKDYKVVEEEINKIKEKQKKYKNVEGEINEFNKERKLEKSNKK